MTRWLCKPSHCILLPFLLEETDSFCGSPLGSRRPLTEVLQQVIPYDLLAGTPSHTHVCSNYWQGIWVCHACAWSNTIRILFELWGVERYGCYLPSSLLFFAETTQLWANYFCDTTQQTPVLLKNHWSRTYWNSKIPSENSDHIASIPYWKLTSCISFAFVHNTID